MITFEVRVNGRRKCRAGAPDSTVLTAVVTWVKALEPSKHKQGIVGVQVGGLVTEASGIHANLSWLQQNLRVGDEVVIRIGEGETADPPERIDKTSVKDIEQHERAYVRRMNAKYAAAKDKRRRGTLPAKRKSHRRPN